MDFKKLLTQLDTISQKQLLIEAENLLERAHLQDIEAIGDEFANDKDARYKALAKLAKDNGYSGMFDPITGNYIDTEGKSAWIGAYKAEIEQLDKFNLIPQAAREKTSHILGQMGKDEKETGAVIKGAAAREKAVSTANKLIKQALAKSASPVKESRAITIIPKGSIAQSLTESFGYDCKLLLESITVEEHKQLKQIIDQVKSATFDPDVVELLTTYKFYVQKRDEIIEEIKKIVEFLKSKVKKIAVKESTGNTSHLKENVYLHWEGGNILLELHLYYNDKNQLVEYKWTDRQDPLNENLKQDVWDLSAGVGNGLTFGYNDNLVAGLKSMFKGTKYADELHNEYEKSMAAKQRSPILYGAGQMTGELGATIGVGMVNPVAGLALGAGQLANHFGGWTDSAHAKTDYEYRQANKDKVDPKNKVDLNKDKVDNKVILPREGAGMHGQQDPTVKIMQQKLMAAGFDVGIHKDDGRFGPDTVKAVKAYTAKNGGSDADSIAKLIGTTAKETKTESLMFSSMSEAERMSHLRNKLALLEDAGTIAAETLPWLAKLALGGKNYAAVLAKLGIQTAEAAELVLAPLAKSALVVGKNGLNVRHLKAAGQEWEEINGIWHTTKNGKTLQATPQQLAAEVKIEQEVARNGGKLTSELEALEHPPGAPPGAPPGGGGAGGPSHITINNNNIINGLKTAGAAEADATAVVTAAERLPLGTRAIEAVTSATSRVRKFSWSKAFLFTVLGLAAYRYIFDDNGNIVVPPDTPVVTVPPGAPPGAPPAPPAPPARIDNKPEEEDPQVVAERNRLKELIQQLRDGWPDDKETAEAIQLATPFIGQQAEISNKPEGGKDTSGLYPDWAKLNKGIDNGIIKPDQGGDFGQLSGWTGKT